MPKSQDKNELLKTPEEASAGATPDRAAELQRVADANVSDRYEILVEVGRGGMGIVYRARDRETDETVAMKVLRPEIANDSCIVERFKNELRLARKITHKNVCRIYDFYRTGSSAYITME